ncbi:hypothetical protein [Sulfobacillus harzensis]|uniref:Flagellar assembly protein FliH/Type III secretion system HrpE domain-containing protein n=1 Tax=Sulfobacillus harzensis TaxID=2729629 RepID=A0A7Y0L579_9FIRM|nr:hypothetical protein [Sulfobacillus harzensis]NMP23549.1 hypothetical protein [Sulfobacillus harzensis]
MISSSRVLKAHQQTVGRQRVAVEVRLPDPPADFEPEITEVVSEVVDRAKSEARAIIEEAEAQAGALREQAQRDGFDAGYQAGMADGKKAAIESWQAIRQQLEEPLLLMAKTRDYLGRLNDESTLALAAALSLAVYSRLKLERLDVITAYIEELASTVDGQKVTLFLDPTWGPRLKALEELLETSVPNLVVMVDDALAQGVMRVEGEAGGALGGPWVSLKALLEEVLG